MENISYAPIIGALKNNLAQKKQLEAKTRKLTNSLYEAQNLYVQMINAQKLLSTISDDNTRQTLDFITGMVNKVMSEILPHDPHHIKLTKKLFGGSKPHIIVELLDSEGNVLETSTQSGDGLNQVISFMYVICLIEIRKGRRLLILDERLNGLHARAKKIISKIIEIFSKGGFQFIFVEYNLNDLGKIYNVEKLGKVADIKAVEGEYLDTMVFVDDVDLSVLDKDYVDEEQGIEIE